MAVVAALAAAAISAGGSYLASQQQAKGQKAAADTATSTSRLGFDYLATSPVGSEYLPSGAAANNSIAELLGIPRGVPVYGAPGGGAAPGATQPQAGPTEPPGITAARNTKLKGGRGSDTNTLLKTGLLNPAGVGVSLLGGKDPLSSFLGIGNNSALQDIRQALEAGIPVSDASWAQAGYGPGGADPRAPQQPQYQPQAVTQTDPMQPTDPSQPSGNNAFDQYLKSTGYQFRLDQGSRALTGNAASKGLLGSGATAKAITDYGQNTATAEFNNYLAQLGGVAQRGLSAGATIGAAGSSAGATGAGAIQQGYGAAAQTNGEAIAGAGGAIGSALNYFTTPKNTYPFPDTVNVTQPRYF